MQLDDTQRAKVTEWIGQGLKLSEIQNKLASEMGLKMTYMETRLLVDDLKLTPKDPEPAPSAPGANSAKTQAPAEESQEPPAPTGGVSLSVDQLTRPGALISGKVVFSDGMKADWFLDETGRLGLAPMQQGYRPPQADIQQFQAALQQELAKSGF